MTTICGLAKVTALGPLLNRRVQADALQKLFAALLLAVAAQMMYRAVQG